MREQIRPIARYDKSDSSFLQCDNNTLRTKLIERDDTLAMRFGQKSFFSSILDLSPHCDYKRHDEYFGEKK